MLGNYDACRKLQWTEETQKAFYDTQKAVNECPRLYFTNFQWPVFVAIDALEEYHIPTEASQHITRHHNDHVGHHGVQRTIERIIREREMVQQYITRKVSLDSVRDARGDTRRDTREDARGDTRRDTREDARRDTRKDTRGDTRKDTRGDTRKDTRGSRHSKTTAALDKRRNISAEGHKQIDEIDLSFLGNVSPEDYLRPWPDMREHVKRFVKRCPCCQKMSYLKVPISTTKFTVSAPAPFVHINVDRIGPLPESATGSNCIMVIIDCFK
jgi:hypothetical protein